MINGKNVLMTGATGYIGSQLCKQLLQLQANIFVLKRPTSNLTRLNPIEKSIHFVNYLDETIAKDIIADHKIDIIIHCATDYNRKLDKASSSLKTNVLLPLQLLEAGFNTTKPVFINLGTILDPKISIYALSKQHLSEWLMHYANDMHCVDITLSQIYGPNDNPKSTFANIIRSLIKQDKLINLTPGEQKRDFIHTADVISFSYYNLDIFS